MRCGVLALQGDFAAHQNALESIGIPTMPVRTPDDLNAVDALAIPGGESSVLNTLFQVDHLDQRIAERIAQGMPVFATCCGVIMLAREVHPDQPSLRILDISVQRNAYGRQISSTIVDVDLHPSLGNPPRIEGVFIRAPRITRVGPEIEILGHRERDPVLLRYGKIVAATFHPELTSDFRVHGLFASVLEECDG